MEINCIVLPLISLPLPRTLAYGSLNTSAFGLPLFCESVHPCQAQARSVHAAAVLPLHHNMPFPQTASVHTAHKALKQVCPSPSPLNRHAHFPYTCGHSSCSSVRPVGWLLLFAKELPTCSWLAAFWG